VPRLESTQHARTPPDLGDVRDLAADADCAVRKALDQHTVSGHDGLHGSFAPARHPVRVAKPPPNGRAGDAGDVRDLTGVQLAGGKEGDYPSLFV
jgi:hypothetical protein